MYRPALSVVAVEVGLRRQLTCRVSGVADDRRGRTDGAQSGQRLRPGHPRHHLIEDDHVGRAFSRELDGVAAVRGFSEHLEPWIEVDDKPQQVTDLWLVVNNQDFHRHGGSDSQGEVGRSRPSCAVYTPNATGTLPRSSGAVAARCPAAGLAALAENLRNAATGQPGCLADGGERE